jgi:hypothetical protein
VDVLGEFTKFRKEYNMYKIKGSYYGQFTDYKNEEIEPFIKIQIICIHPVTIYPLNLPLISWMYGMA